MSSLGRVIIAYGAKENMGEDIQVLAKSRVENPKIVTLSGPTLKQSIREKASALFVEENLVLVLPDPPREAVEQTIDSINVLKDRSVVIVYVTSSDYDFPPGIDSEKISLEKEKEERVKTKVLIAVRAEGKKMTDKAYSLLKERIRDEALLEHELEKILSYVGDKKIIEVKDVATVVTETHEEDFISLSDAMARKDRKQIMMIINTLLGQGMGLLAVHGFLTRHINLLLQTKDVGEFFKSASDFRSFSKSFSTLKDILDGAPPEKKNYLPFQKPYYAYNLCKTGQRFSDEILINFIRMLAQFDKTFKRGTKHDRTHFEATFLKV